MPTSEVYAEDWWNLSRPVLEFHGYFRVRTSLFHNFSLGRVDSVKPLWPQPSDNSYFDISTGKSKDVKLCGDSGSPNDFENCSNNTNAGANMRFRFSPTLHISDNLRIKSQIDLFDNIMLGSTPQGYGNIPGESGGYQVLARGGYQPISAFSTTQWAPVAGYNSTKDSITVKRVWGEYSSPIGQLRFGRMPSHWGLGMVANSGNSYDDDWETTADRLMFVTGYRAWDLYFAAAWDFAAEGANSSLLDEQQGQAYDLAQKDDVDQFVFALFRKQNEQDTRKQLAMGGVVLNGGAYVVYRNQNLANDTTSSSVGQSLGQSAGNISDGLVRRGAEAIIPDLWFQLQYKRFRFEIEAAMIYGSMENRLRDENNDFVNENDPNNDGWKLFQYGFAAQTEFRAIEDRLKIGLDFGYASGDADVESIPALGNELQPQLTLDRTYSTFRFHPAYVVDQILFRRILTRIQGAYYVKPKVGYDFFRDPDGQKIGGEAGVIWSRASEFVQAPGNARDLGVELNFQVYYQAKDGVLNDDPNKMGGFFTMLQYGVLFPLSGLGYLPNEETDYAQKSGGVVLETATAQSLRWYLGIMF